MHIDMPALPGAERTVRVTATTGLGRFLLPTLLECSRVAIPVRDPGKGKGKIEARLFSPGQSFRLQTGGHRKDFLAAAAMQISFRFAGKAVNHPFVNTRTSARP